MGSHEDRAYELAKEYLEWVEEADEFGFGADNKLHLHLASLHSQGSNALIAAGCPADKARGLFSAIVEGLNSPVTLRVNIKKGTLNEYNIIASFDNELDPHGATEFTEKHQKEIDSGEIFQTGSYHETFFYGAAPSASVTKHNPTRPELNDAFWAWFGASVVVDDDGKPLVVYHGTNAKFTEFSKKFSGLNTDIEAMELAHLGHWFSDKSMVERDGSPYDKEILVYLAIENPLDVVLDELFEIENADDTMQEWNDEGFDGLRIDDTEWGGTSYVAFSAAQIKSVKNFGDWSPDNPDIMWNPPKPRQIGSATVTRMPNFQEEGLYDVNIGNKHYQIFRDQEDGWWFETGSRHYTERLLGFNLKEAVESLESR